MTPQRFWQALMMTAVLLLPLMPVRAFGQGTTTAGVTGAAITSGLALAAGTVTADSNAEREEGRRRGSLRGQLSLLFLLILKAKKLAIVGLVAGVAGVKKLMDRRKAAAQQLVIPPPPPPPPPVAPA